MRTDSFCFDYYTIRFINYNSCWLIPPSTKFWGWSCITALDCLVMSIVAHISILNQYCMNTCDICPHLILLYPEMHARTLAFLSTKPTQQCEQKSGCSCTSQICSCMAQFNIIQFRVKKHSLFGFTLPPRNLPAPFRYLSICHTWHPSWRQSEDYSNVSFFSGMKKMAGGLPLLLDPNLDQSTFLGARLCGSGQDEHSVQSCRTSATLVGSMVRYIYRTKFVVWNFHGCSRSVIYIESSRDCPHKHKWISWIYIQNMY